MKEVIRDEMAIELLRIVSEFETRMDELQEHGIEIEMPEIGHKIEDLILRSYGIENGPEGSPQHLARGHCTDAWFQILEEGTDEELRAILLEWKKAACDLAEGRFSDLRLVKDDA